MTAHTTCRHRGFSIIELMVGLLVGLLVSLAVFSTTIFMEAQRRTSISGDSAFGNGLAGLLAVQSDVKSSGIGIWMNGNVACQTINIYNNGATMANGAALAPVMIDAGATAADSDTVTVLGTSSILGDVPIPVVAAMQTASATLKVASVRSIAVNNFVIVANPGGGTPCTLMQVTATATTSYGGDIDHGAAQSTWNPPNPATAFANAPAYPAGSLVYNVGTLNWTRYRVNNGNLEAVDLLTNTSAVVADNVVAFKAYYGTTNGTTEQIEQWVDAGSAWASPLDAAHVNAIRAVRLAVVARSAHPEKPSAGNTTCDATTAAPLTWVGGPVIDLSGDAKWQCYRYRTFTLVVPLKNLVFGAMQS